MKLEEYKNKILKEEDDEKRQQILLNSVDDEDLTDKEFVDLMIFVTLKVIK